MSAIVVLYIVTDDPGVFKQHTFSSENEIPQEDLESVDNGDLDMITFKDGHFCRAVIDSVQEEDDDGNDTTEYSIDEWQPVPMPS